MDTIITVWVDIGNEITLSKVRMISAMIIPDTAANNYYDFVSYGGGELITDLNASNNAIKLSRASSGNFDNANFDTASSYNRGYVTVWYEV